MYQRYWLAELGQIKSAYDNSSKPIKRMTRSWGLGLNEFTRLIWTGNPKTLSNRCIHLHMFSHSRTYTDTHLHIITESKTKTRSSSAPVKTLSKKRGKMAPETLSIYSLKKSWNSNTRFPALRSLAHTFNHSSKTAEANRIFLPISPKCPSPDGPKQHTWHSV